MSWKQLLFKNFGINLPISGGMGNSILNPIVIHKTDSNDYVSIEYSTITHICKLRNAKWETIGQKLITENGKTVDNIQIKIQESNQENDNSEIENFYFDFTEFIINSLVVENVFDEVKTLNLISERLKLIESESNLNSKCVNLLRKGELHNDTELIISFLDVILKDESLPLFESMMNNKRKSILDVLRLVKLKL